MSTGSDLHLLTETDTVSAVVFAHSSIFSQMNSEPQSDIITMTSHRHWAVLHSLPMADTKYSQNYQPMYAPCCSTHFYTCHCHATLSLPRLLKRCFIPLQCLAIFRPAIPHINPGQISTSPSYYTCIMLYQKPHPPTLTPPMNLLCTSVIILITPIPRLADDLALLTMHWTVRRSRSLRKSSPIVGLPQQQRQLH